MNEIMVAIFGLVSAFLVRLIEKKTNEIKLQTQNEVSDKYITLLSSTITECVISTNQTFVESLKAKDKFDKEAQKEAFNLTYEKVMAILTEEAKVVLSEAYGDLTLYVTTKIESEVNANK